MVPSSPWRPCSAMKAARSPGPSGPATALGRDQSHARRRLADCRCGQHAGADISETSRSALWPPISTATLPRTARVDLLRSGVMPRLLQSAWQRAGNWLIEPAPMPITTSPARRDLGQRSGHVGHGASTKVRRAATAWASALPVGAGNECLASAVDLGQQHHVGLFHHRHEVGKAVARAGVAGAAGKPAPGAALGKAPRAASTAAISTGWWP